MQMTTTFSFADAHEMQIFFAGMADMLAQTQSAFTQLFAKSNATAAINVRDTRPLPLAGETAVVQAPEVKEVEKGPSPAPETEAEAPKQTRKNAKKTEAAPAETAQSVPEVKPKRQSFEVPAGAANEVTEADLQTLAKQIMEKAGKDGGAAPIHNLMKDHYGGRKFRQLEAHERATCLPQLMAIIVGDEIPF